MTNTPLPSSQPRGEGRDLLWKEERTTSDLVSGFVYLRFTASTYSLTCSASVTFWFLAGGRKLNEQHVGN